jgi:RNA polymerase sigma-70 factor (ECF subfamily)
MFNADELINHQRVLLGYAAKVTGDWELARDLVQDTFLRAIKYKDNYDDNEVRSLGAWLQTILMNVISSHYKAMGCRPQYSKFTIEDIEAYAPLYTLDKYYYGHHFRDDELDKAYNKLKFAHRQIVYLTYVEDESDKNISKRLGIPLNTCYTRRKSAVDTLRQELVA